jgi:hypothetical protein
MLWMLLMLLMISAVQLMAQDNAEVEEEEEEPYIELVEVWGSMVVSAGIAQPHCKQCCQLLRKICLPKQPKNLTSVEKN